MRILCLHGVGSSGAIFEVQMAGLRRVLDPSFDLVFVDGPFECKRGPGMPEDHDGPFYSHVETYAPIHVAQGVEMLESILVEEGPFDGIFGFSQGAALTLSYFYRQQAAGAPIQVRFACLFSSAMPCSPDADMGNSIISSLRARKYSIGKSVEKAPQDLPAEDKEFVDILRRTIVDAAVNDCLQPWIDTDVYLNGEREDIPRIIYPSMLTGKIQVPTVHVWGQNDRPCLVRMSEVGRSICEDSNAKTVLHTESHGLPRKGSEINAVVRQIDWLLTQV